MSDLGRGFGKSTTGFEDRGVLDRSRDDVSRATAGTHGADEGKVVGLGAAGGEDDFFWFGADQGGYLRPRGFDSLASDATFVMQARWIAKCAAKKRAHRCEHPRIERRGGGMIEINSRIHGASPAWLRWALRALKTQMPHPGYWDEATAHRDLMSPANRAGIDTSIRLVPDPVVVASMGPLPSATLHETAASFRHECLNTINDRTHGNRCQEINFREPSRIRRRFGCFRWRPCASASSCFGIIKRPLAVIPGRAEVV